MQQVGECLSILLYKKARGCNHYRYLMQQRAQVLITKQPFPQTHITRLVWITFWFELSKYGKHEMRTILSNQVQIFSVNHMTPKSHNSRSNYSSNLLKGCAIQLGIFGVQEGTRTSKVNSCFLAQVRYMYMCHQAFKLNRTPRCS